MCAAAGASESKDRAPDKGERQAEPVGALPCGSMPIKNRDGGAQGGDLRQRQVDEDHAALHHVHAQIGMDAGQNQAGNEGPDQKRKNFHVLHSAVVAFVVSPLTTTASESLGQQINIVIEQLEVVGDIFLAAHRGQILHHLAARSAPAIEFGVFRSK